MLDDLYWGLFTQSGNVDAYLAYKKVTAARRTTETDMRSAEGEDSMKR